MLDNLIITAAKASASKKGSVANSTNNLVERTKVLVEKARLMRSAFKAHVRTTREGTVDRCDYDHELHILPVQVGDSIGRRYKITRLIGSGNMANVHLAEDQHASDLVAVKSMFGAKQREILVRRFVREAGALAVLSHPNIVNAKDIGWDQDRKLPYIVMENLAYSENVSGELKPVTFKYLMKQFKEQKIDISTMLYYYSDICEGLSYLNERVNPIIHRDLKPDNILVSNGFVFDSGPHRNLIKLSDFGLVRIMGDQAATTLTKVGSVAGIVGSPGYAAIPDMYNGDNVSHRSDLYSLGVMLYELISGGNLPFKIKDQGNKLDDKSPAEHKSPYHIEQKMRITTKSEKTGFDPRMTTEYEQKSSYGVDRLKQIIQKHLFEQPDFSEKSLISGVDPELIALTQKLLSKDPNDRPRDAASVKDQLRNIAKKISQKGQEAYSLPSLLPMHHTQVTF